MNRVLLGILLFGAVFVFILSLINQATVSSSIPEEGINCYLEPQQTTVYNIPAIVVNKGSNVFSIKPLAAYDVSAQVKSKHCYFMGWESDFSPCDYALAWGQLVNQDMDNYISYSQGNRWYYTRFKSQPPVSRDYIINHSANTHVIPATENLKRAFGNVNKGDQIRLQGYLVNIDGKVNNRNVWWKTSLRRSDSGNGACEVFYVKKLFHNNSVYE